MNTDLLPREGLILCAVSGGMDSMYLLCRLRELGYFVAAAHYNHGIRGGESDRDETFVREFCAGEGIPFCAEKGDAAAYAAAQGLSVEDGARKLRYAFLEKTAREAGAAVIATAHTAEDNAETLLLNLVRGTGLRGLGGIPPVRGNIVRPMLEVTRAEIESYMAGRNIPHVEDSTNAMDIYARNRIRHEVMPVLKGLNPAFVRTAGRTAELLRRDGECLDAMAERFVAEYRRDNALPVKALMDLPEAVRTRAVRRMGGETLSAVQTEAVLALQPGGVTDVSRMRVGRTRDRLVFGVRMAEPIPERELVPGEWTEIPEAGLKVRLREGMTEEEPSAHGEYTTFSFSCEHIYGTITIASRREGDRFRPAGRGCAKSLKQLFMENDIPAWERDAVPVLRDEKGVLFVWGIGPDERISGGLRENNTDNVKTIEFCRMNRSMEDADNA